MQHRLVVQGNEMHTRAAREDRSGERVTCLTGNGDMPVLEIAESEARPPPTTLLQATPYCSGVANRGSGFRDTKQPLLPLILIHRHAFRHRQFDRAAHAVRPQHVGGVGL